MEETLLPSSLSINRQINPIFHGKRMAEAASNELITRAQSGNPEACGALYTRYHQAIYRYLYYRTGDPHIAEDLTSEVFLKMVQALPRYRIQSVPFQAWLFQIARNLAIDYYRRSSARPTTSLDESQVSQTPDIDSTIDFRLTSASLSDCLSRIGEVQRDVLLLRFIDDLSIADTASILHKTEDSIKGLQRRALEALRNLLDRHEVDYD
jgi:RNA polymerase sigma-70 factor (ECF subfamily)